MKWLIFKVLEDNIKLRKQLIQLRRQIGWHNKQKLAFIQQIKMLEKEVDV